MSLGMGSKVIPVLPGLEDDTTGGVVTIVSAKNKLVHAAVRHLVFVGRFELLQDIA